MAIYYITDEEFSELMEQLLGTRQSQRAGLDSLGLYDGSLTKAQRVYRDENYKRCRNCKKWVYSWESCC